jgi:cobalamin synthase
LAERYFAVPHTIDEADKVIRDSAKGFFVIAGLLALTAFFLSPLVLIDAAVEAILAFILMKFKSRVAAVVLLGVALGELFQTVLNRFFGEQSGGRNVILAVIVVWAGVRAVQGTFKRRSLLAGVNAPVEPA